MKFNYKPLIHKLAMRLLPGMHEAYQDLQRERKKAIVARGRWKAIAKEMGRVNDECRHLLTFQDTEITRLSTDLATERDILMNLVAKNDDGAWVTTHDADTFIPKEQAEYLDELVART